MFQKYTDTHLENCHIYLTFIATIIYKGEKIIKAYFFWQKMFFDVLVVHGVYR